MDKEHFDQLVKGVREMKRRVAGARAAEDRGVGSKGIGSLARMMRVENKFVRGLSSFHVKNICRKARYEC